MRIYLYFADKTLIFTDETSPARFFAVDLPQGGRISRTKILNFLETHNEVAVCTPDPEQAFSLFRQEFAAVEAAGGVVSDWRGGPAHQGGCILAAATPALSHLHIEQHPAAPAELLAQLLGGGGLPQLAGPDAAPQLVAADEWRGWMDRAPREIPTVFEG